MVEKFNIQPRKRITILVAPLDWGLGHATRCIPLITYLISIGCNVVLATDGMQEAILRQEFPNLRFVELPGYKISFSKNRVKTLTKILWQIPKILTSINRERRWLNGFLNANDIRLIISDNRYGLNSPKCPSVFITHQLTIKTPFSAIIQNILRKINYHFINKFTECWVPDFAGEINLGGLLSHPKKFPAIPVHYLGRLSRIDRIETVAAGLGAPVLILLSGPEPQRTILEEILLDQLKKYPVKAVMVRGLPGSTAELVTAEKDLVIYNHLTTEDLTSQINQAAVVISRSGYSTLMDLIGRKKCVFIPTPGQPEQEYLAQYLSRKSFCLSYPQDAFELGQAIKNAKSLAVPPFDATGEKQYQQVIDRFLENNFPHHSQEA